MRRFFVPSESLRYDEVSLSGDVFHHLRAVLRLSPGDEILLLDGEGLVCRSLIETLGKCDGKARVLDRWFEKETAFPVSLLQALPKADKMELVLQKGTELGISTFAPIFTERSIPRLPKDREAKRLSRWEKIVREAARQCRRPCLPQLSPPRALPEALSDCSEELRLMLWEQESRPLAEVLPAIPPEGVAVLVGPEGGFSSKEAVIAQQKGFIPVRIGPRILRTETAGFIMASILQFLYGDLGAGPTSGLA